jgi:hypothetical protein
MLGIAPQSPQLIEAMQSAAGEFKMKACYCSVLDECWETNFDNKRPTPVPECKVNAGEKLW